MNFDRSRTMWFLNAQTDTNRLPTILRSSDAGSFARCTAPDRLTASYNHYEKGSARTDPLLLPCSHRIPSPGGRSRTPSSPSPLPPSPSSLSPVTSLRATATASPFMSLCAILLIPPCHHGVESRASLLLDGCKSIAPHEVSPCQSEA
jgi:hypothetical protein